MDFDVAVIGAGPVGLCMARDLVLRKLRVALIDPANAAALSDPPFDGREIALTHASEQLLHKLGVMQRIPQEAVSALRDARVINGPGTQAMTISHALGGRDRLGFLVANHLIRKASMEAVQAGPLPSLFLGQSVQNAQMTQDRGELTLSTGTTLSARLVLAADGRFSAFRRSQGVSANMHDFGKAMMVCNMAHELPHDHIALEWFDFGQTLALLPMNGMQSSVVLTLPARDIDALTALSPDEFNLNMTARFHNRLGAMSLQSERHAYPLVTVYADRFAGMRFALLGDAAVGMHPVTAHGFNFGLKAVELLGEGIAQCLRQGADLGDADMLARYQRKLRLATRPLFLATHAIAKLYTSENPAAMGLRAGLLRIGERVTPFKKLVAGSLTGGH